MKKFRKIICGISTIAVVAMAVFLGSNAMAVSCPSGTLNAGQDLPTLAECNVEKTTEGSNDLMTVIGRILNVALGLIGFVAVVFIIFGGFQYITSSGDAAKVAKAKNTLLYSVVGLIVVLLAFAIVNFVINGVTSSDS